MFEVISVLPQYGLTRADERLLRRHACEIVEQVPGPVAVAELGSGSGKKTRWLLKALCRRQHVSYFPIEISPTALAMCERELGDIDCMSIVGFEREYLDGLVEVAARRREGQNLLVLFLGSTIGNFDRPAAAKFLREVRHILQPGDSLLLGTDLEKPIPQLLAAYDDPLGVTAAFNLNLLARINRELDADFVLEQFEHVARFNPEARSVEMHLRSRQEQSVTIPRAGLTVSFPRGRRSGPRAATSTVRKRCPGSPGMRAFSARRSGLIRNGPLPRTCSWRSEANFVSDARLVSLASSKTGPATRHTPRGDDTTGSNRRAGWLKTGLSTCEGWRHSRSPVSGSEL